MSSLNLTESARKTFRCPNCRQYISSNVCPKCSFQITDEMKQALLKGYDEEVKQENRKFYKPFIFGGIGGLLFGLFLMAAAIVVAGELSVRGLGFFAVGLGGLFFGLRGLYRER